MLSYWMLFPKGAKAKAAILKCCMPKGMPMIVIHSKRSNPRCVRQIQKPPTNIQIMFMISDKHPPELPSSTTRLPKGHKASIANFKVWRPKGIPMIVIISIRLDIRYSTLVIIPPKSNHIIFPKNFIR